MTIFGSVAQKQQLEKPLGTNYIIILLVKEFNVKYIFFFIYIKRNLWWKKDESPPKF